MKWCNDIMLNVCSIFLLTFFLASQTSEAARPHGTVFSAEAGQDNGIIASPGLNILRVEETNASVRSDRVLPTVGSVRKELVPTRLPLEIQAGNHFLAIFRGNAAMQNDRIGLIVAPRQGCMASRDEVLQRADLHNGLLFSADLSKTILTNTDLFDTTLSGVNLFVANRTAADL